MFEKNPIFADTIIMKTILYVILDKWADWELAYISSAVASLGGGQFENKTVSLSKGEVKSIGGISCVPDHDVQTAPSDFDALILIGGMSWRNEEALRVKPLVERCVSGGKVLGAICDACRFLASLGALNSVRHTANDKTELEALSAYTNAQNFVARQSVSDNGIVTANGTAPLEFAIDILRALNVADESRIMEWYTFHKLGFYTVPLPKS